MQCPICKESRLIMTTREEIEIDCCPTCRGVWLDRGELEKIIGRSPRNKFAAPATGAPGPVGHHDQNREIPHRDGHRVSRQGEKRRDHLLEKLYE